jgi:hypothetical protein
MKHKFYILWLASILSTVAALPYIFALQHDVISKATIPLSLIGLLTVTQTGVLMAIAIYLGLKISQRIGLSSLVLFDSNIPLKQSLKDIFKFSVPIGIAAGFIIKLVDQFFSKYIPEIVATTNQISPWKALLVAPYGGVVEELLLRLFCVSLLAWLIGKITKIPEAGKNNTIMWSAIIGASVIFGLGHLPVTATIIKITPIVLTRAILLNGIGGVMFGWLYWKKGLEYAIVAHFTTDIVLHVILTALIR